MLRLFETEMTCSNVIFMGHQWNHLSSKYMFLPSFQIMCEWINCFLTPLFPLTIYICRSSQVIEENVLQWKFVVRPLLPIKLRGATFIHCWLVCRHSGCIHCWYWLCQKKKRCWGVFRRWYHIVLEHCIHSPWVQYSQYFNDICYLAVCLLSFCINKHNLCSHLG